RAAAGVQTLDEGDALQRGLLPLDAHGAVPTFLEGQGHQLERGDALAERLTVPRERASELLGVEVTLELELDPGVNGVGVEVRRRDTVDRRPVLAADPALTPQDLNPDSCRQAFQLNAKAGALEKLVEAAPLGPGHRSGGRHGSGV